MQAAIAAERRPAGTFAGRRKLLLFKMVEPPQETWQSGRPPRGLVGLLRIEGRAGDLGHRIFTH
ncbi:hypothetical protein GCM10010326_43370 [Streptomyces xanthochromogenes]|uniref:Transposase n=1 Tax=Streptomyces xanthochromogenes TaxID=67384 RepID=A0ABQ3AC91_9ACTN|nr:hypothetical protein GCM10010326_43370 [Streptomyces xanthochromogenes]